MNRRLQALGKKIHDAMLEFAKSDDGHWDNGLTGGCAVGAYLLMKEAKAKLGLDIEFVCTGSHSWNQFNDYIYDITATQYGGVKDKVYIVHLKHLDLVDNVHHKGEYKSVQRDSIETVNRTWLKDQRPANHRIEWINQRKARVIYKEKHK
jgi:hypothetical protein